MIKMLILTLLSFSAFAESFTPPTVKEIAEVKANFKFRGQWISPVIVRAFNSFDSDSSVPTVQAIDVGGSTGRNRFFGEIKTETDTKRAYVLEGSERYSYDWIGKLDNGLHVLVTRHSGDGTLVSTDLLVLRVKENQSVYFPDAYKDTRVPYTQILLELVRYVPLGDRAFPTIKILKNNMAVKVESNLPGINPRDFELAFK